MPMIRAWVNPIFNSVPRDIRYQGMIPMSIYAAINPASWMKSPYFGVVTYLIVWWWFWNNNMWNTVRYVGETWEDDKLWWLLRTSLWSFFLNPILLFFVYLCVLMFVRITSMQIRLMT